MTSTATIQSAVRWVTPDITRLFNSEIDNEENGGVSPATLSSTIDSVAQMPADLLAFDDSTDVPALLVALLMIRDLLPGRTEVGDLLDDAKRLRN